jgi:hypothetical protein
MNGVGLEWCGRSALMPGNVGRGHDGCAESEGVHYGTPSLAAHATDHPGHMPGVTQAAKRKAT